MERKNICQTNINEVKERYQWYFIYRFKLENPVRKDKLPESYLAEVNKKFYT